MKNVINRVWWTSALFLWVMTTSAWAEPPKFGYSGLLVADSVSWESLDLEGKKAHLEQRLDLAIAKGATVIRLGNVSPNPLARESIEVDGERDWALADFFVQRVKERGLQFCATLPELVKSSGLSGYKAFLSKLIERYDGDADFGVAEVDVNQEHPDVDGSGSVTFADWGADNGTKKAWAVERKLDLIEIGDQPHVAETAGELAKTDYLLQLEAVYAVLNETGATTPVMLGTTAADNQSQGTFQTRFEGIDPASAPLSAVSGAFDDAFADISGDKAVEKIEGFFGWAGSIGYPDTERWIGSMRVGGTECVDTRCGERLKASLIVKAVLTALHKGYGTILYGDPIMPSGSSEQSGKHTAALWNYESDAVLGGDVEMASRPATDVWLVLVDVLAQVDLADIELMPGDNPLVVGYKVGDKGWIYWYNWTRQVGPGESYSGKEFQARLDGLELPAIKVATLWKEEGDVEWPYETIVVEDGSATFMVGQDVMWVTATDAPPTAPDLAESDDLGTTPDSAPTTPIKDDGCSAHHGTSPWGLSVLVLIILLRRRTQTRRA